MKILAMFFGVVFLVNQNIFATDQESIKAPAMEVLNPNAVRGELQKFPEMEFLIYAAIWFQACATAQGILYDFPDHEIVCLRRFYEWNAPGLSADPIWEKTLETVDNIASQAAGEKSLSRFIKKNDDSYTNKILWASFSFFLGQFTNMASAMLQLQKTPEFSNEENRKAVAKGLVHHFIQLNLTAVGGLLPDIKDKAAGLVGRAILKLGLLLDPEIKPRIEALFSGLTIKSPGVVLDELANAIVIKNLPKELLLFIAYYALVYEDDFYS